MHKLRLSKSLVSSENILFCGLPSRGGRRRLYSKRRRRGQNDRRRRRSAAYKLKANCTPAGKKKEKKSARHIKLADEVFFNFCQIE